MCLRQKCYLIVNYIGETKIDLHACCSNEDFWNYFLSFFFLKFHATYCYYELLATHAL
jgi:hypothetical protein